MESGAGMENKENAIKKIDKVTETLIKELEGLSEEGLHEFFMFFYKMNHQHGNMIAVDKFEEFLETFDNKHPENDYWVKFNCPEFTSLCPITGQPDFANIIANG